MSSCRLQLMHDVLLGRTPIGDRVWDMSRLIDWAIAHQGVDPARIAITGNSGGGTVSLFAAACDTRISVAVPGCYFNTFAGSIGSIMHCDCNYVPGILRLGEMHDVAGLIAPRPFLAVAGRDDRIFPVAHTRPAFEQLAGVYRRPACRTVASCTSATAATATTRNASGPSSPRRSPPYEHRHYFVYHEVEQSADPQTLGFDVRDGSYSPQVPGIFRVCEHLHFASRLSRTGAGARLMPSGVARPWCRWR